MVATTDASGTTPKWRWIVIAAGFWMTLVWNVAHGQEATPPVAPTPPPAAAPPPPPAGAPVPPTAGNPPNPAVPAVTTPVPAPAQAPPAKTVPVAPPEPANAALQAIEAKAKAEQKKKAEPKVIKEAPRQEHLEKPGADRAIVRDFEAAKELRFDAATPQEMAKFDRIRRGQDPIDLRLLDKVAKTQVYKMTLREQLPNISKLREDIEKSISGASGDAARKDQFIRQYKTLVVKYAKDLLDNSLVVRVNTLILLGALYDGTAEVNAIPLLLTVLKRPGEEEGVLFEVLKALQRAKSVNQIQVTEERDVVNEILTLADRRDIQDILKEEIARTLGIIGRPHRADLSERAEVATYLARMVLNKENSIRVRHRAAVALGKLRVNQIPGWNYELMGYLMAYNLRDLVDNATQVNTKLYKWWLFELFEVIRDTFKNTGNEAFQDFAQRAGNVILAGWNDQPPPVESLNEWLAKRSSWKDVQFTERADKIRIPGNAGEDTPK